MLKNRTVNFGISIKIPYLLLLFLFSLTSLPAQAIGEGSDSEDAPDTLQIDLEEIKIQATRRTQTERNAPYSVSIKNRSIDEIRFEPGLSLNRIVGDMPGLWVNNRENYALGERMSIRGMGWNTPWGVRGVNVILDGIPLTLPDGQTTLDVIDPAFIREAELIRGPNSSLWGNAGGGTLLLSTEDPTDYPKTSFRTLAGSHEIFKVEAATTIPFGDHQAQAFASFTDQDGYRDHSQFRSTRLGGNARFDLNPDTDILISAAYANNPDIRHPGSLTREEFEDDPTQADPRFVEASAGKTSEQGQFGFTLDHSATLGDLSATLYGIRRDLHNPLPFVDIELDRSLGGARLSLNNRDYFLNVTIGADGTIQRDDRRNWAPDDNYDRGSLELNQKETVSNAAGFATLSTSWDYFNLTGNIRYDMLHFRNDDDLQLDGINRSGSRTFSALSPGAGVSLNLFNQTWFARYGTAFESPTTTELVNSPPEAGGAGRFNEALEPQHTTSLETGVRGGWAGARLQYDLSVFDMDVKDQIVGEQGEDGREYYLNQYDSRHRGFEGMLQAQPMPAIMARFGYTYSDFTFRGDTDFDGNRIPGIPEHRWHGYLRWIPSEITEFWLGIDIEYAGEQYVNNQNYVDLNEGGYATTDPYMVIDLEIGHRGLPFTEAMIVQPFVKLNNLTDRSYPGSININAFSNDFYEPGSGITFNAGFTISFRDPNS